MADIELVVKIPEEMYAQIIDENGIDTMLIPYKDIIKNGIPLPKGHGTLKDADVMINKLCTHEASEFFGSTTCAEILDFINAEKPIIEADIESRC